MKSKIYITLPSPPAGDLVDCVVVGGVAVNVSEQAEEAKAA